MRVVKMKKNRKYDRREKKRMHGSHIMLMGWILLVREEASLDAEEAGWTSVVERLPAPS